MMNRHFIFALCTVLGFSVSGISMAQSVPVDKEAAAKAAINKAAIETVAAGKATETTEFTLLFDTHDQKEGMAAMIEKRSPVFTNN